MAGGPAAAPLVLRLPLCHRAHAASTPLCASRRADRHDALRRRGGSSCAAAGAGRLTQIVLHGTVRAAVELTRARTSEAAHHTGNGVASGRRRHGDRGPGCGGEQAKVSPPLTVNRDCLRRRECRAFRPASPDDGDADSPGRTGLWSHGSCTRLHGVLAEIESLGLDLIQVRQVARRRTADREGGESGYLRPWRPRRRQRRRMAAAGSSPAERCRPGAGQTDS